MIIAANLRAHPANNTQTRFIVLGALHQTGKIMRIFCSIFALGFMALVAAAQTAQAKNLLEVYELALTNSPAWAAAKAAQYAGQTRVSQGQAGLLPQLQLTSSYNQLDYDTSQANALDLGNSRLNELSGCLNADASNLVDCLLTNNPIPACGRDSLFQCLFGATDNDSTFSSTTYGVSATQPLFRMDRWFEYRRSQALTRQANLEFDVAYQDFNLKVVEIYFAQLSARESLNFLTQEGDAIFQQLQATKRAFKRGSVSSLDALEAQSIYDLHQARLVDAQTQLDNAIEDLAQLTGTRIERVAPLPTQIPLVAPYPANPEAWVELSKRHNPNIRVAYAVAQVATKAHQGARAARLPRVDLNANYQKSDADGATATLNSGTTTSSSIGINLSMPLYTGGSISAQERNTRYKKREADYHRQEVLQVTVAKTRNTYRSTLASVKLAKAQETAIASSEKALIALKRGYRRGLRSVTEVFNGQQDYYQAQREYSNARINYVLASLTLKRTAGLMKRSDLKIINGLLVGQIAPPNQGLFDQSGTDAWLTDEDLPSIN